LKKIAIYDPPMCCSTGVCGASVDQELLRVALVIDSLKQGGADISRYNLSGQPQAFVENELVSEHLRKNGPEILPITVVDGQIAKTKLYPTNEELAEWTGIALGNGPKKGGGCCDDGCC
jgi:hypothetical protein